MRWGRLGLRTVSLELPERSRVGAVTVALGGRRIAAAAAQEGRRVTVTLGEDVEVTAGSALTVVARW